MDNKIKRKHRIRRHNRVRASIKGTRERPRVSVFRSNKHIFVQLINDTVGKTILSSKMVFDKKFNLKEHKTAQAAEIGKKVAKKAKEAGIERAVLDRSGYKYHGRVKALAEGLREGGLKI